MRAAVLTLCGQTYVLHCGAPGLLCRQNVLHTVARHVSNVQSLESETEKCREVKDKSKKFQYSRTRDTWLITM